MLNLANELYNLKNEDKAKVLKGFFKTGKGQYGYGDKFLGITVPVQRKVVKKYYENIKFHEIEELLHNEFHEVRLSALLILIYKMKKANALDQTKIYNLYIKNIKNVNNWDLVDLSAPNIIGFYLYHNDKDRTILYDLADSTDLWEQRIAVVSTLYFIRHNKFSDTINISKILLESKHDLIQKAVGWMLREVGKRDYKVLYNFLLDYHKKMPRTMLRYAIERFDSETRKKFLLN